MIVLSSGKPPFAEVAVSIIGGIVWERWDVYHRVKMAESPPLTDLSGGKTFKDSFTRLIIYLVMGYVVDFQSDLLLSTTLGLIEQPEGSGRLL